MIKADDKKANSEVENLNKQLLDCQNNWKRALADYQNLERRVRIDKEEFAKYAKSSLIMKILPVIDNLEKTAKHITDQGLAICIKSFQNVLMQEGLTEINVTGKDFDPHTMEAIETVESDLDGKVIEILQKGYKLYDRVIRPAHVKVTKIVKKEV
ncbi:nucleotide exchange factor GrpE [Candidatus Gottesmanbacteria bacterium]|nr:nucleotide exchange factor GrpE [Candidatus Gottesmanbacteria bacterium]